MSMFQGVPIISGFLMPAVIPALSYLLRVHALL